MPPSLLQAVLEFGDPEVRETATTECTIDVGYNLQGAHVWCTPEGVKEYCAELVAEYRKMQETVRQQREQIIALQRSLAIESHISDTGGC
jgi:hypothetical protein